MVGTVTVGEGTEVEVEHVEALPSGGARFDIAAEGKRWRLDVGRDGSVDVVTTWDEGQLADVPLPEWMDEVVARLQHA
ncbi:hypothetical protein GJ629_08905 [Halapricum sp. CBA1109]|uniref:hypothetical protein n=1 Tax=Halapricum sp. CBA1109 TaxID=2668068 RepID=UPI0012F7CDCE|nr:hypothetical protein [Halapricum sp. CBA1109]MUV89995.1 hypothetical protein [Halapricum sp. CBA1109]